MSTNKDGKARKKQSDFSTLVKSLKIVGQLERETRDACTFCQNLNIKPCREKVQFPEKYWLCARERRLVGPRLFVIGKREISGIR